MSFRLFLRSTWQTDLYMFIDVYICLYMFVFRLMQSTVLRLFRHQRISVVHVIHFVFFELFEAKYSSDYQYDESDYAE